MQQEQKPVEAPRVGGVPQIATIVKDAHVAIADIRMTKGHVAGTPPRALGIHQAAVVLQGEVGEEGGNLVRITVDHLGYSVDHQLVAILPKLPLLGLSFGAGKDAIGRVAESLAERDRTGFAWQLVTAIGISHIYPKI